MSELSRDDRLQMGAEIKERIAALYNDFAELALTFADGNDGGALASQMVTSTQEVTTWADVYATFGPDTIEPTDPLDKSWWRAILKTDNPRHWLQQARDREMTAAQIRNEAGVKQERKPPWYEGGGTYSPDNFAIFLDAEPPDRNGHRLEVRARVKDE